ncbi:MAG TPA: DUF2935 domain-containing protein [Bacillales bacterium]|nr:DUF2935 domain-containing protein [Bacillales bacterium]
MKSTEWKKVAVFEHSFWLQVLGDHARFLYYAFPANERAFWQQAQTFIQYFDQLLQNVRTFGTDASKLREITQAASQQASDLRQFKLTILRRQLVGSLKIDLTPTFVNHMVNELDEYLRILGYLQKQQVPPPAHPVHYHLLWLLDASGHSGVIEASLDLTESQLKQKSHKFTSVFQDFYLKAVEMAGYLRANIDRFPALSRFNHEAKLEILVFQKFLKELEEMELQNTDLSTFSPLMADHMYREECYYLLKLAEVTDLSPPDCNPAEPRVQPAETKK